MSEQKSVTTVSTPTVTNTSNSTNLSYKLPSDVTLQHASKLAIVEDD